jgi:hypothetical protein
MAYKGIAKGKTIELEEALPYPEGQPVSVIVEPLTERLLMKGSPEAIRRAMHEPPHLTPEDVADLERAIEEGKLPVREEGIFEEDEQGGEFHAVQRCSQRSNHRARRAFAIR